ncbi:4Fe-4S binding protein [Pantoea sp. Mb-10]|uniref:indolepyruvate ferredoxin oxidoreductase subunit alpha n=1 Tax=unclassified Pantoea TaxID=2630326 RepID=UPI001E294F8F|nr:MULTISPECIES: 4Fe-4S binding protein [unclassified Pantoea]MCE0490297.1 4Fe-4S binding protein [Pantoea sp. Mb-10]MCE0501428.1 4Fe-4S binding protein [Pantoea sp. Pb-8]
MAFYVKESCETCKSKICAEACPVDAFIDVETILVINPRICISCGVCETVCPVEAIGDAEDEDNQHDPYIKLNEELSLI